MGWCLLPLVSNCVIYGNSSSEGGGIYYYGYSASWIVQPIENSIIWNNEASTGPEIYVNNSTLTISYSDVKGGKTSVYAYPGSNFTWGDGMIDADPLFVIGPEGDYYLSQKAAGQTIDSPCLNTGSAPAMNLAMHTCWTRNDEELDTGIVDMGFHYGPYSPPTLTSDHWIIPETSGGSVEFSLMAGSENASRDYILLGGITGTSPGFKLPGGQAILPLNWDIFTDLVVLYINSSVFSSFLGALNGYGSACATLNMPPVPGFAGVTMYYAYALNNPWDFVSNPVAIEIVP